MKKRVAKRVTIKKKTASGTGVRNTASFLKMHRFFTVGAIFAVIGGMMVVYRAFAVTGVAWPQTNSWEYTVANGSLKLAAEGICNFTTKFVSTASGIKVASVKCDVRDENYRDTATVYTDVPELGPWSAGKGYQACFWISPDTPVGVHNTHARQAIARFEISMFQGEEWGDSKIYSTGYVPKPPYRYSEYCTLRIDADGRTRKLTLMVRTKLQDASFRVSRIVLKEFTPPVDSQPKNPQPAPQSSTPPPNK